MRAVTSPLSQAVLLLVLIGASTAGANDYARTRYPIILAHGMVVSPKANVLDYWNGIDAALAKAGATVYVTQVPALDTPEARGEVLLHQIEDILARTGHAKANLIGHSQGGIDIRYVAAVRPELVASITTVGSPHFGAELADVLSHHIRDGVVSESASSFFSGSLRLLIRLLSGKSKAEDAVKALGSVSTLGMAAFNARYPAGLPTDWCGEGPDVVNGIRYYSWSGTDVRTNILDVSDLAFTLSSKVYSEENDGVVGRCSSHFGAVIRDDYSMNHLDQVNRLLGLVAWFSTSPKSVYRSHANRLQLAGL